MRVPVSMVVRMNSASNMMAKWYQYFSSHSPLTPIQWNASLEDDGHADGQRHRPAGAAAQRLAADLLFHLAQVEVLRRTHVRRVRRVVGLRRHRYAVLVVHLVEPLLVLRLAVDGHVDVVVQFRGSAAAAISAVTPTNPSMSIAP